MNRGQQPFVNKILKKKWQARQQELHKQKLLQVKPLTDTKQPISCKFPLLKSKKKQIQEDKLTEIERENRLLLEKMSYIMNGDQNNAGFPKSTNASIQPNQYDTDNQQGTIKRSLNRNVRHRELLKINQENKHFLDRIRQQKSHYNQRKWDAENSKHVQYLKNLSEYPERYDSLDSRRNSTTSRHRMKYRQPNSSLKPTMRARQKIPLKKSFNIYENSGLTGDGYQEGTTNNHDSDEEMTDFINQVKSENDPNDMVASGDPMSKQAGYEKIDEFTRNFNSDLKDTKNVMTPDAQKSIEHAKAKLNQTDSHFHSRTQSNNFREKDYMMKQNQDNQLQGDTTQQQIKPLNLRFYDEIEPNRIVLYREDCREIMPTQQTRKVQYRYYVIEISRTKRRLYIVAVKIPNSQLNTIVQSRKAIKQLAQNPGTKVYALDLTEKQGKKLLYECNNDFKKVVDRIQIAHGKLTIRDLDQILKYGNPDNQAREVQTFRMTQDKIGSNLNFSHINMNTLQQPSLERIYNKDVKLTQQYASRPPVNNAERYQEQVALSQRTPIRQRQRQDIQINMSSYDKSSNDTEKIKKLFPKAPVTIDRKKNYESHLPIAGKWEVIRSPMRKGNVSSEYNQRRPMNHNI